MPEVYAVEAKDMCYYASLELMKIFGAKADAEAYAEELREMTDHRVADCEPSVVSIDY